MPLQLALSRSDGTAPALSQSDGTAPALSQSDGTTSPFAKRWDNQPFRKAMGKALKGLIRPIKAL